MPSAGFEPAIPSIKQPYGAGSSGSAEHYMY